MAERPPLPEELEHSKFWVDYLKHLSTLSTGSIVLISTFLEKIAPHPVWKTSVIICLIGFLGSVLGSVLAMTAFGMSITQWRDAEEVEEWVTTLGSIGLVMAWSGFSVGVFSLTLFTIKNLPK